MTDILVLLRDRASIMKFLQINSRSECQIDVSDGRTYIDGKSLVGLLSLGFLHPLHVSLIGDEDKISNVFEAYRSNNLLADTTDHPEY